MNHPGERDSLPWLVHTQANLGEDQKAFDLLPLLRKAAEFCQWWISGEICSKPVMKCSLDQKKSTLLTLCHAKHTVSVPNQWGRRRASCLKSNFYIILTMLCSLSHDYWTLSLCWTLSLSQKATWFWKVGTAAEERQRPKHPHLEVCHGLHV